jgi:mRNA interferase MazF
MPLTTGYSFGDVVLVPIPITDQSGIKKRPAVIVSSAEYQAQRRDIVIMAITSQIRSRPAFGEVTVAEWKKAGLIAPSDVKPVLTTIEKRLVLKRLGQLQQQDIRSLRTSLAQIFG